VRRFLQYFAALAPADWDAAAATFGALERTPRFVAADAALGTAIERADRVAQRDAVVGPLLQLVRAGESTDELHPVAPAALAALLALVARDLLDGPTFATLTEPFAEVVRRL
jgi:hypothetical protein